MVSQIEESNLIELGLKCDDLIFAGHGDGVDWSAKFVLKEYISLSIAVNKCICIGCDKSFEDKCAVASREKVEYFNVLLFESDWVQFGLYWEPAINFHVMYKIWY